MPSHPSANRTGGTARARVSASGRASVTGRNTLPTLGSGTPTTPVDPQTGTPPQISGVAAIEISDTGAIIVWSLDQPATGQVYYGPTASYGSTTTLESSYTLNAHAQSVSGLTPSTLYHYKVRSVNAEGQASESADATFTTLASIGTYPTSAALRYVPMNSDTMPTYLGTIVDSTWGTMIRRITNVDGRRNRYGYDQAWSKDGDYLYLPSAINTASRRMLHGTTYADLYGPVASAAQQMIWRNTVNLGIAYNQNGRLIYSFAPATNVLTQTATFAGTGASRRADQPADWNFIKMGGAWVLSSDDHLTGFWAQRTNGSYDAVAYDPVDDRIEAYLNLGSTEPTAVVPSIGGNYMIVDRGPSGSGTRGVYTMTARSGTTPGTFTHVRDMGYPGHGMPIQNAALADMWVNANGDGKAYLLSDGSSVSLIPTSTNADLGHVGYAIDRPGYVYWSFDYVNSGHTTDLGYGQLFATPVDAGANPQVEVFGNHHNMVTTSAAASAGYEHRLFACPNRDGSLVLFGSDWHGEVAYSGSTYAFVAGVTA